MHMRDVLHRSHPAPTQCVASGPIPGRPYGLSKNRLPDTTEQFATMRNGDTRNSNNIAVNSSNNSWWDLFIYEWLVVRGAGSAWPRMCGLDRQKL